MQVNNYASDLAVKTFESAETSDIEQQINIWMLAYPHMFVTGIEISTSIHPQTHETQYIAVIVYQPSEQNEI
ncbi:hypothetical protein SAMN05720606_11213 [Paenibacillus polysaccharolyticus]|uniref:Sporulation protein Cse60 n=1 Tax=Paenibacillus polysaccharolyticus TaxID=582692 RepID=A0A1G5JVF8_9BACL|nr:hypothetical protein [Paenibacillus polysaccharolyticus]SCY91649.1 hypothetical protein SAMN05720606_11213 [Paenibacillus polysaccharolyticus]